MITAIIGRPNVGKSSLFNRLIGEGNRSLTADTAGVTRDYHYGRLVDQEREVLLIDTGGFYPDTSLEAEELFSAVRRQTEQALSQADHALLVADGREGLLPVEQEITDFLRKNGTPFWIVVNKVDSENQKGDETPFYALGVDKLFTVSSAHGLGIGPLREALLEKALSPPSFQKKKPSEIPKVAILGMPNSGKSTLLNRLVGFERSLVSPIPGTTVDPVSAQAFSLEFFDTAGIKKKSAVQSVVEEQSIFRSLRCLAESAVVIYLIDATKGVGRQDKRLLDLALRKGKPLVICMNKMDKAEGLSPVREKREKIPWADFCDIFPLCAKTGQGLDRIKRAVEEALRLRSLRITTGRLNRFFAEAVSGLPRPSKLKIKYASMAQAFPPTFLLFTNKKAIPEHYKSYLKNGLRKEFALKNTPVRLVFKR